MSGATALRSLGLARGEHIDMRARGRCMRGLDDGGRVRVVCRHFYVPGDIVVVRRRDHWNVHRFLGYAWSTRGLLALTRADDSTEHDPPALARRIVGRAEIPVTLPQRLRSFRDFVVACGRQTLR